MNEPKISANKIVEYCFATPQRRTTIIEDIIRPKNFLLDTRYNDIERAMMYFVESHGTDDSRLVQLDRALLSRKPSSSHDEQRLLTAHDAIELSRTTDISKIPSYGTIAALPERQPRFNIVGISVSIRPTNSILVGFPGKEEKTFGLLRPYIAKCQPLTTEMAALHGALLHWYAEESYSTIGVPDSGLCFVIDVFAQKIFSAPKSFKQRRKLLQASCQEIVDRWVPIKERMVAEDEAISKPPYRRAK